MAECRPGDVYKVIAVGNHLADLLKKLAHPQGRQKVTWDEANEALVAWQVISGQGVRHAFSTTDPEDDRMWKRGEKVT